MVQWLGCGIFTAIAWVQPLFREIRSHKPLSTAKKKKKLTMRYEWPKYRTLTIPNAGKDIRATAAAAAAKSVIPGGNAKWCSHFVKVWLLLLLLSRFSRVRLCATP